MKKETFKSLAHIALSATPLIAKLTANGAVVLERKARAGGATRWFYCPDEGQLGAIEAKLSPGSVVSFYFDHRIRNAAYSSELNELLNELVIRNGEAIVGFLSEDGVEIIVEEITGPDELVEFLSGFKLGLQLFFGVFPARDHDELNAITVTMPDGDGIFRAHPH